MRTTPFMIAVAAFGAQPLGAGASVPTRGGSIDDPVLGSLFLLSEQRSCSHASSRLLLRWAPRSSPLAPVQVVGLAFQLDLKCAFET